MLESIAKLLGASFVLPTLALLGLAWAVKFLFDLHVSTRQSRKDFLDVWRGIDLSDDVLLETTVRHLWGTYLPASVIRALLISPFPTEALRHAVAIWDHLHYDPRSGRVRIRSRWLARSGLRKLAKWVFLALYVVLAAGACLLAGQMAGLSPTDPKAWLLLIVAATFVLLAFASIARSGSVRTLDQHATEIIQRINSPPSRQRRTLEPPASAPVDTHSESAPPKPFGHARRRGKG